MKLVKFMQDKKEQLSKSSEPEDQAKLEILEEVLLYAKLNNDEGTLKFKKSDEWSLDADIKKLENDGHYIVDVQMSAAANSVAVSAGDRESGKERFEPVRLYFLIKYI